MKHRFLKILFISFPLALAIILGVKWLTLRHMESALQEQLLMGEGKNVLVVGHSHGEDAINDSILDNWANRCRSGEMMWGAYTVLENMIENNKVDTVVIPMLDFVGYTDHGITTQYLLYESTRMALASRSTISDLCRIGAGAVASFYLTNDLYTLTQPITVGAFENWDHHGMRLDLDDREASLKAKGRTATPAVPLAEYSLQTRYTSRIIDLCHSHGITVVAMNYPKYHYDKYMDCTGVHQYYNSLGDSVVIADYERFALPDTSFYANVTHLNRQGAAVFSTHLKTQGKIGK